MFFVENRKATHAKDGTVGYAYLNLHLVLELD